MPLLVKTQRVMGWETLLWCNQITDCPSIENSPSTERTSVRSVWAVRVAFVAACPREWGCAGAAGKFSALKHGHAPWTARWFRRSLAQLNPVSCDGSAPTRAEPCWRWSSEHAVAQHALRVIESEANEALPHSLVMFVTMGGDWAALIGLTLPFEHPDELGLLSCVVAGSRQCTVGSLGGGNGAHHRCRGGSASVGECIAAHPQTSAWRSPRCRACACRRGSGSNPWFDVARPSINSACRRSVSYTHLTLPTKRIV